MGYNKICLYGNQICDYLYIQKSKPSEENFKNVNSEPTEWSDDSLLLAKFNNDLVAGDSAITERIDGYEIRRQKGISPHTEYVGTIPSTLSGENKSFIIDYMAANNADYTYYLYPSIGRQSNNGTILAPIVSDSVKTKWDYWSLFVVDESEEKNVFYINKIFKFELNLETGDMSNNAVVSINQNFTKHPTIHYGTANYWSSTLTSLCGFISCANAEYIQTPNMIEELKSLTSDTRRKFLKDIHGNIWEVKITAPINISTDDSTLERIKTVKISWSEVGDAKGISIINNPSIPTTSWVLTESGEAVSYISYIWDDQYKWDDSFKWTERDDILETKSSNLGREIS